MCCNAVKGTIDAIWKGRISEMKVRKWIYESDEREGGKEKKNRKK